MFVDCPPSSSASFLSFSIPRLFFQVDEHMERWKQRTDFVLGAFKKETDQFVAEITVIADDWSIPDFWISYFADVYCQGKAMSPKRLKLPLLSVLPS